MHWFVLATKRACGHEWAVVFTARFVFIHAHAFCCVAWFLSCFLVVVVVVVKIITLATHSFFPGTTSISCSTLFTHACVCAHHKHVHNELCCLLPTTSPLAVAGSWCAPLCFPLCAPPRSLLPFSLLVAACQHRRFHAALQCACQHSISFVQCVQCAFLKMIVCCVVLMFFATPRGTPCSATMCFAIPNHHIACVCVCDLITMVCVCPLKSTNALDLCTTHNTTHKWFSIAWECQFVCVHNNKLITHLSFCLFV